VNKQCHIKYTALILACKEGHKEIVLMLLQHKNIDVNLQDLWGNTALTYASERGDKEMFEMLEEAAVAKAKSNKRGMNKAINDNT
jgi:ankyrin repeat protein